MIKLFGFYCVDLLKTLLKISADLLFFARNVTDLTLIDVILSPESNLEQLCTLGLSVLNYGMTNNFYTHSRQLNYLIKHSPILSQLELQTDHWEFKPNQPVNYKWQFIDGMPENAFDGAFDVCLYNTLK